MGKLRILHPNERAKHPLLKEHAELLLERQNKRKGFTKKTQLNKVEDDLEAVDGLNSTVPCYKCETLINLDTDNGLV